MLGSFRVGTIRAAEEAAIAIVGEDALMQRAAAGLASVVLAELRRSRRGSPAAHRPHAGAYGARVLLVVGAGNNGGDALFAGVRLARRGVAVTAWLASANTHRGGLAAFRAAGGRVLSGQATPDPAYFALVLDAFVGIGGRPGLPPEVATVADACRREGVPVVAVDVPSGLAADGPNRALSASFAADVTVTFGGRKHCLMLEPASSRCGRVEVIDIGLSLPPADLVTWERTDIAAAWPIPGPLSDKYSRGVVGIDAGSSRYPGAAVLAVLGATHAGAGMVRLQGTPSARLVDLVLAAAPNVVVGPGRVQAQLLGPGWGQDDDREGRRARLAELISAWERVVVDADALGFLPSGPLGPSVLLMGHAGELARLAGVERAEVERDPITTVASLSGERHCAVLLKGATQYVGAPDGSVAVAVPGPSWTAQAGSGDVLAGVAAAVLAGGCAPEVAGLLAASTQALAAVAYPGPRPPQEVARRISSVIADCLAHGG